jgi:hypothetical protein
MASAMRERGRPDAAATIVDDLTGWIDGEPVTPTSASGAPETEDDDVDGERSSAALEPVGAHDPALALARALSDRAANAPLGASSYRPRPVVDFREGRTLRMSRPAVSQIPRLVVEPYLAPARVVLSS